MNDARRETDAAGLRSLVQKLLEGIKQLRGIIVEYTEFANKSASGTEPGPDAQTQLRKLEEEYSALYLSIDAWFDDIASSGIAISNPNSHRQLNGWWGVGLVLSPRAKRTEWLRFELYGPVIDPLEKAISRSQSTSMPDSEFRGLLCEYFGECRKFNFDWFHPKIASECRKPFDSGDFEGAVRCACKVVERALHQFNSGNDYATFLDAKSKYDAAIKLVQGIVPEQADASEAIELVAVFSRLMRVLSGE